MPDSRVGTVSDTLEAPEPPAPERKLKFCFSNGRSVRHGIYFLITSKRWIYRYACHSLTQIRRLLGGEVCHRLISYQVSMQHWWWIAYTFKARQRITLVSKVTL